MNKFNEDRQRVRQLVHSTVENRRHVSFMWRKVRVEVIQYKDRLITRPRLMPHWMWRGLRALGRIRVTTIQKLDVISLKGTVNIVILPKGDSYSDDQVLIWRLKHRHFESFDWERGSSDEFDAIRRAVNAGPVLVVDAVHMQPYR